MFFFPRVGRSHKQKHPHQKIALDTESNPTCHQKVHYDLKDEPSQ